MRKIKFRGKCRRSKRWTYGFLVIEPNGTKWISNCFHKGEWIEVDPKTVGQLTGALDRNSGEIYEGDIAKFYDEELGMWIVIYDMEYSKFELVMDGLVCGMNNSPEIEIIGNIHDNHDLICAKT